MIHRTPTPNLEPTDFIQTTQDEDMDCLTDYDLEIYEEQCNCTESEETIIQIYHQLRKRGIV